MRKEITACALLLGCILALPAFIALCDLVNDGLFTMADLGLPIYSLFVAWAIMFGLGLYLMEPHVRLLRITPEVEAQARDGLALIPAGTEPHHKLTGALDHCFEGHTYRTSVREEENA